MGRPFLAACLVTALGASACTQPKNANASSPPSRTTTATSPDPTRAPTASSFKLQSSAFAPNAAIPANYTCDGANQIPPLAWSGAPAGASRLVLIVMDPDAPGGNFTHWVVWDLPVSDGAIGAGGSLPFGAQEGLNSAGKVGYDGPCPPAGSAHHYHFTLYAVDAPLGLSGGASRTDVDAKMAGHVVAHTELVGTYTKK